MNLTPFWFGTLSTLWLDDVAQQDGWLALVDDGAEHRVELNHPRAQLRRSYPSMTTAAQLGASA